MKWRIAIMASGQGTNAKALIEYMRSREALGKVVCLISDKESAPALTIARDLGIPTFFIPPQNEQQLLEKFSELGVNILCLAGYMKILSGKVLNYFNDAKLGSARVLNIHPSLLPDYPGLHAFARAFNDGIEKSGVSVHLVTPDLDAGPLLAQAEFSRLPTDDLLTFTARGQAIEHDLYPKTLEAFLRRLSEMHFSKGKSG